MKLKIEHWDYSDGWRDIPYVLRKNGGLEREFNKDGIGWRCWAYVRSQEDTDLPLDDWMKQNMKGAFDCTWRFNSGDPMFTVYIREDEDATLFKLKWL